MWLGSGASGQGLDATLEGNTTDALMFMVLLVAGIVVLLRRSSQIRVLLRANWPILLYFSYCLLSVLWSDFPDAAFKRWTKSVGDLVMVLIIVTDGEPVAALRRLFARVGFILLPASVYLIRYSDLGRGYDPDGYPMNTGVTTNKNTLGVIVFVLSLGAFWRVLSLLCVKGQRNRGRKLVAQSTILAFGVALLSMAHSATAGACFALGAFLIVATSLPMIRRSPGAAHALVLGILLAGGLIVSFGGQGALVHALGRQSNLTGRTDIWKTVIPMAQNSLIGSGFQTFWNSSSMTLRKMSQVYMYGNLSEAHNGYIEVYLQLGWVGVSLIALILLHGYRRASATLRRNPELGNLLLAYLVTAALYSITEAGFRMLSPVWIFLLMAIVASDTYLVEARASNALSVSATNSRTSGFWSHHSNTRPQEIR
jgi:O-antigen ligase